MDRSEWLKQKRREAEERYDTLWAPLYGEKYGIYGNATHQRFLRLLLALVPQHSAILDAACGAGRYLPALLEHGHSVVGIDQSQGMLSRAAAKFPSVRLQKMGLQEMRFAAAFEGIICIDAMEHVPQEDWALVLGNFHRALKPEGCCYFTVELAAASAIDGAFARGKQLGIPLIHGETMDEEVYHYYPPIKDVRQWTHQAGLAVIDEGEGDEYHHFVARKMRVAT